MTLEFRHDGSRLRNATRTSQGFVRAPANLTRTGVLIYHRADGSTVRELRHPDDVFHPDSLASAEALPVTVGHRGEVTPENVRDLKVGQTVSAARADGRFVKSTVQVEAAGVIADIDGDKLGELSVGYTVKMVPGAGVYNGERYDARQTEIRYNHLALLPKGGGRAGSEVSLRLDGVSAVLADEDDTSYDTDMTVRKIRLDGVEVEVPEAAAARIASLEGALAASEKAQGAAEAVAKAATARADAAELPAALDARVAERVALVAHAQRFLGKDFSAAGLSTRQVQELALAKAGVKFEGRSDAWLAGAFEATPVTAAALVAVMVPEVKEIVRKDSAEEVLDLEKIRADAAAAKSAPWKATK